MLCGDAGDKLCCRSGQVEGTAFGPRDGGNEEEREADHLWKTAMKAKDVPGGKKAPDGAATLLLDDVGKAETVGHQEHAHDGHSHRQLVADHLRGTAQAPEQRILSV